MAPRKRRGIGHEGWVAEVRERISATMLVKRLVSHILGEVDLKPTQVQAALGLLKKVVPDLSAIEHSGEVTQNHIVRLPAKPADMTEWQKQHEPPRLTIQ